MVGVSMRMFGASALRVCLLCAVAGSASAGCKVDVVFQHAPKHTNHFEQVLARAENGDPTAQFQAAVALETGEGTAQDYAPSTMPTVQIKPSEQLDTGTTVSSPPPVEAPWWKETPGQ